MRLLPDVCPRAGTAERVLLAVTAGVRAPLLSLTARAADVSLWLPPSKWLLARARPPPGPSPRSPAPADRLLREAPGAGSVSLRGFVKSPLDLQRSKGSRAPITARPAGHVLPLQGFYVRWRRRRQIDPMGIAGVRPSQLRFRSPSRDRYWRSPARRRLDTRACRVREPRNPTQPEPS